MCADDDTFTILDGLWHHSTAVNAWSQHAIMHTCICLSVELSLHATTTVIRTLRGRLKEPAIQSCHIEWCKLVIIIWQSKTLMTS